MKMLFQNLSVDEVDSYGLVLTASGIGHQITKGEQGWTLWVEEKDAPEALRTIGQYLAENEPYIPPGRIHTLPVPKNWSGVGVSVVLVALHILFRTGGGTEHLFRTYGSSAGLILSGEYFRAVTSLMLHGSIVHLLGNAVGIAIFGSAVCAINGVGFGWLMILTAGATGNLLNAHFYRIGHFSIGSSTAIFGALGILVAQQSLRIIRRKETARIKAWVPFACGLALLGLLGTGEQADLMAHFFGFLTGIPLGLLVGGAPEWLTTPRYQHACLAVSVAILFFSWLTPLMGG